MTEHRVLLVGHAPPGTAVGSIRMTKFAKYLPSDWNVHALTSAPKSNSQSEGSLEDCKRATVHSVSEIWASAPKDFDKARWILPLVAAIRRLHARHDFDVIWQTANPFLPLAVVPIIRRLLDIPYVVDLRDAWTLNPYSSQTTMFGRIHRTLSKVLEPWVLETATGVTTATSGLTEAYEREYPDLEDKFRTIENGYDPDDFPPMDVRKPDKFTIVYVGKFGDFRDAEPFLKAMARQTMTTPFDFIHVGNPEPAISSAVDCLGLGDSFRCTGYVERDEVTRQIRRAHLGLAVSGGSPQEMTTKIFDYIACETPILACGPPCGSMAAVVHRFEHGYTVPNEADSITSTLTEIIRRDSSSLGSGPYANYTRERSAEKLDALLHELL